MLRKFTSLREKQYLTASRKKAQEVCLFVYKSTKCYVGGRNVACRTGKLEGSSPIYTSASAKRDAKNADFSRLALCASSRASRPRSCIALEPANPPILQASQNTKSLLALLSTM